MENLNLQSSVIVQGYLLELLLLNLVHHQKEPLATLEHIRFQLRTQLAADLQQGLVSGLPEASADLLRASLDGALSVMLDRVAGQLLADEPPKYQA